MSIGDRRWSSVGFIVMMLGLGILVVANFSQELGIPLDVPLGWFGSVVIVLGVTVYLVQRRAEQDGRSGDPPAPS
jgi:predicted membrane channel-forming protein YqfA (hemolysin III family)